MADHLNQFFELFLDAVKRTDGLAVARLLAADGSGHPGPAGALAAFARTRDLERACADNVPADYAALVAEDQMGVATALMSGELPGGGSPSPRMLQAVVEQLRGILPTVAEDVRDDLEEAIEAVEDALDEMEDGGLLDGEE